MPKFRFVRVFFSLTAVSIPPQLERETNTLVPQTHAHYRETPPPYSDIRNKNRLNVKPEDVYINVRL